MTPALELFTPQKRVKILQITDTHLFGNKEMLFLGINTYQSLNSVVDTIVEREITYDCVVLTGDFSQDQSETSYHWVAQEVEKLNTPCVWLPGNHDNLDILQGAFSSYSHLHDDNVVLFNDSWCLLLLNSQVPGKAHGYLSDEQLDWLKRNLTLYRSYSVFVFLHHHPIVSQCTWLDQHQLKNSHQLSEILARHSSVSHLACGHIHQELELSFGSTTLWTTPSTSVQFKPNCAQFTLDTLAPGWREIELGPHGEVTTHCCRVTKHSFLPNMDSEGY